MTTRFSLGIAWVTLVLGALGLVVGPVRLPGKRVRAVPGAGLAGSGESGLQGIGEFTPDRMFPGIVPLGFPVSALGVRSSWTGSGANVEERCVTGWFAGQGRIALMVSGYPQSKDHSLDIEAELPGGGMEAFIYSGPNPGESWMPWVVTLPEGTRAFRIRASGASHEDEGWVAFSQPFFGAPLSYRDFWAGIQLAATVALVLTLVYGPGLVWLALGPSPAVHRNDPGLRPGASRLRGGSIADLVLATLPGPLILGGLGIASWALGGWIPPAAVARAGVLATLGCVAVVLVKLTRKVSRRAAAPPPSHGRAAQGLAEETDRPSASRAAAIVVGVGALLVVFTVAKADLSFGPPGELYRTSVSRSLEIGGHSDSRIPFHVVQLVAHHSGPFSQEAHGYFAPWSFSSRGPVAGLAAAPIVLALGAEVPRDMPDQAWAPFDIQGFAVYRITMIVLASLAAWAVFGVASELMNPDWGLLTASVVFLAPFFVHEMFFTWPKLLAATQVLVAFYWVRKRAPGTAGATLGYGYLCHPMAALAAPFLFLWILGETRTLPGKAPSRGPTDPIRAFFPGRIAELARFSGFLLAFVAAWLTLGRLGSGQASGQDVFFHYFFMADAHSASASTWIASRWNNFANTFIPFRLLFTDPTQPTLNSYYGPSDGWVHFGFLYWNTLPFAIGWPAFLVIGPAVLLGVWRAPRAAATCVLAPAALLVVYWGYESTGLMLQCGQWLFLATIIFGVWCLGRTDETPVGHGIAGDPDPGAEASPPSRTGHGWRSRAARFLAHPVTLALGGLDVAWMALGTPLHARWPDLASPYGWNDVLALLLATASLIGAVAWLAAALTRIRPKTRQD